MFAANSDGRARLALAIALTIFPTAGTWAHGFAGSRFFPATITIDDPFVADELSLPTVSNQKRLEPSRSGGTAAQSKRLPQPRNHPEIPVPAECAA
jgi:hypothetical protein